MTRWIMIETLLLLTACSGAPSGGLGLPPVESAGAGRGGPVALLHGTDETGRRSLFQLRLDQEEPEKVAGTGAGNVTSVSISAGGTALAWTVNLPGGVALRSMRLPDRKVRRHPLQRHRAWPGWKSGYEVRGVSDDGDVLVLGKKATYVWARLSSGTLAVTNAAAHGVTWYAPYLSADGARFVFSAAKASCASGRGVVTCPVNLFLADLSMLRRGGTVTFSQVTTMAPGQVSYNAQLVDGGRRLIYMTNRGDSSYPCRKHVNNCTYKVVQQDLAGDGKAVLLADQAVFGRRAADGTLSFRRRKRHDWDQQTLFVGTRTAGSTRLLGDVYNAYHFWSPDSRWLVVQRRTKDTMQISLVHRTGKVRHGAVAGRWPRLDALGWMAAPLPAAPGRLRAPRTVGQVRHALARLGPAVKQGHVGAQGLTSLAMAAAQGRARTFGNRSELLQWMSADPRRRGVVRRADYCNQDRVGLAVDFTVSNDLVVFRMGKGPASAPAKPAGTPVATFDASKYNGGVTELVGSRMPATARAGQHFTMELRWRVKWRPPVWWKVFVHFDRDTSRFHGDHTPAICGLHAAARETVVADRFDVEVDSTRVTPGVYDVYVGWWRGYDRAKVRDTKMNVDKNRLLLGKIRITK